VAWRFVIRFGVLCCCDVVVEVGGCLVVCWLFDWVVGCGGQVIARHCGGGQGLLDSQWVVAWLLAFHRYKLNTNFINTVTLVQPSTEIEYSESWFPIVF
jgi:hypothetical protein